jgi:diketogulonate reductase-like aldo/keto reductase
VVNFRRQRQESIAEHFGVLAELRDAGLIRHLGVSQVSVRHLAEARAIAPVVCVENRYNLEIRDHEPLLRACSGQGIAFTPYYAIAGEQRESGGATDSPELAEVARRHGVTIPQVRLA